MLTLYSFRLEEKLTRTSLQRKNTEESSDLPQDGVKYTPKNGHKGKYHSKQKPLMLDTNLLGC